MVSHQEGNTGFKIPSSTHWRMGRQGSTEEPGGEGLVVAGLHHGAVPVIEGSWSDAAEMPDKVTDDTKWSSWVTYAQELPRGRRTVEASSLGMEEGGGMGAWTGFDSKVLREWECSAFNGTRELGAEHILFLASKSVLFFFLLVCIKDRALGVEFLRIANHACPQGEAQRGRHSAPHQDT